MPLRQKFILFFILSVGLISLAITSTIKKSDRDGNKEALFSQVVCEIKAKIELLSPAQNCKSNNASIRVAIDASGDCISPITITSLSGPTSVSENITGGSIDIGPPLISGAYVFEICDATGVCISIPYVVAVERAQRGCPDDDNDDCTVLTCVDRTCVFLPINPEPTDLECWQTAILDTETCMWEVTGSPPDCEDNDCNTADSYDSTTCECVNTPITPPSCDDDDCTTTDSYDTSVCECVNTPITPPSCDDDDCTTMDSYDTSICECVNAPITPPSCDDDNCTTTDSYDTDICACVNTPNTPADCDDDNDCTKDSFDEATCECLNEEITGCGIPFIISIADPCSCGNPNNIILEDGTVLFYDIITVTTEPGLPSVNLSSNDGRLLTETGLPVPVGTEFIETTALGVYILEVYTLMETPAVIEVSNGFSVKLFITDSCTCAIIPTMGEWGLISLFLLLLIIGITAIKSRDTLLGLR